jgi:hypothetical protein
MVFVSWCPPTPALTQDTSKREQASQEGHVGHNVRVHIVLLGYADTRHTVQQRIHLAAAAAPATTAAKHNCGSLLRGLLLSQLHGSHVVCKL